MRMAIILVLLLLLSTFTFNPIDEFDLDNLSDGQYTSSQGKRSKSPLSIVGESINLSLNETNEWVWVEINAATNKTWVNITTDYFDYSYYGSTLKIRAYTHSSKCIDDYFYIYAATIYSSLCENNAADSTILVVVDITDNGVTSEQGYMNATLNAEEFHPTPNPNYTYEFPDGDLNADSTSSNPINATSSASGFFEFNYDVDYFEVDVALAGTYRINVTLDQNLSIYSSSYNPYCTSGTITNTSNNYYECLSHSRYTNFYIHNNSWNAPINEHWQVQIQTSQVHSIEDPLFGDAPSSFYYAPTLHSGNWNVDGNFLSGNDADWYSTKITHGHDQEITIVSENHALIIFDESYVASLHCKDPISNVMIGAPQTIIPSQEITIICASNHFSDEIAFKIYPHNNLYDSGLGYNYTIGVESIANNSDIDIVDYGSTFDAPPRSSSNVLDVGIYSGGFKYSSDRTDEYTISVPPNSRMNVRLESNCAYLSYKSESIIGSRYFVNNGEDIELRQYLVQRDEIPASSLPVSVSPPCEYLFNVSSAPFVNSWSPTINGRLSITTSLQMENSTDEIEMINNINGFVATSATIPFDMPPNEIATISASQSSGEPLTLTLYGTYSTSGINQVQIGGMIEVGMHEVSWSHLSLIGIDGSQLSISMDLSTTQLLTDEVNEIKSLGFGALGVSNDEGFDKSDHWTINNTDDAKMVSIRLMSIDEKLNISFEPIIQCTIYGYNPATGIYEDYFPSFAVDLNNGSGQYSLRVDKLYEDCPLTTVDAPNIVSAGSTIKVNSSIFNTVSLTKSITYELVDDNLQTISSSQTVSDEEWTLLSIPSDAEGEYRLLVIHESGFVLDSQPIIITNNSQMYYSEVNSVLDLGEKPKAIFDAYLPYQNIPSLWALQNITFYENTINGTQFLQNHTSITGVGLEVVEFDLTQNVKPGVKITMQAELVSREATIQINLEWIAGVLNLRTECQSSIQPVIGEPESDLKCNITGTYSDLLSSSQYDTRAAVSGKLLIYSTEGQEKENHSFVLVNGEANIRIPTWHYSENDYYAVSLSDSYSNSTSLMSRVDNFFVDETLSEGSELNLLGSFDFSAFTIKNSALPGDEVTIQWNSQGEAISAIKWFLASGEIQSGGSFAIGSDSTEGSFKIVLPSNLDPDSVHQISIMGYSIYGQVDYSSVSIYGADYGAQVYVDINPQRPSSGEQFTISITAPSANEWLSYEWSLEHENSILSSGEGWVDANRVSFKASLPAMQFSSIVQLRVTTEDHSGQTFFNSVLIEPMPMREIHVNTDDHGVAGKEFEFSFSIEGEQLNSIDQVKTATVTIFSMSDVILQQEIYIINDNNGDYSTLIPDGSAPGTYLLSIEFELLDGELFEHRELLTILAEEEGISVFGLMTIPSLPHGFDTVIVAILAIFLLVKGKKRYDELNRNKGDTEYFARDNEEDSGIGGPNAYRDFIKSIEPVSINSHDVNVQEEQVHEESLSMSDTIVKQVPQPESLENLANPEYERQQYPADSGDWWERDSPNDEWRKLN